MVTESMAWQDFEDEVFQHLCRKITAYRTLMNPRLAKVLQRKGYFSKDRQKDIVFDIAVEVSESETSPPSLLWLFECKDYPERKVGVAEVEEFWTKMQQVSAHKGSIYTRVGFEDGGFQFAKSKKMELLVLNKEIEERIAYSETTPVLRVQVFRIMNGILTTGREITESDSVDLDILIQIELRRLAEC